MAEAQLEQWSVLILPHLLRQIFFTSLPLLGTIKTKFPQLSLDLIAAGKISKGYYNMCHAFFPRAHTSINQFYWEGSARVFSRLDTVQMSLFIYREMYTHAQTQLKEQYACEPNAKMLANARIWIAWARLAPSLSPRVGMMTSFWNFLPRVLGLIFWVLNKRHLGPEMQKC